MKSLLDRLRRRPAATGLCCALLALLGCAPAAPGASLAGSRPNIVLVVLCSLRADHLGSAGYERGLTPFLDRLAATGVAFDEAVASSSWTKPTAASLVTGLTPNVHQMLDFYPLDAVRERRITPRRVLPQGFVTLPEALAEAGYATACRVNNVHAGEFFGLTQGCQDQVTRHGMRTPAMVADLAAWLAGRDRERPFFFLLFTRDVHTPYNPSYEAYLRLHRTGEPPPPAEGFGEWRRELDREVRRRVEAAAPIPDGLKARWVDLYDAQLPALDAALEEVPRVLAQAGAADDTWIVVTADHGERFFEHGGIGHGGRLDEAVLEVPLIFHGRGIAAGRRVPGLVRSIDLYPTLAAVAGAALPPVLQGESLLPLLAGGGGAPPGRSAFASFNGVAHAVRQGRWKLYAGPGDFRALYDLAADPGETRNLLSARGEAARRLARELRRWRDQEEALARAVAPAGTRDLPPEVLEELRALGYL